MFRLNLVNWKTSLAGLLAFISIAAENIAAYFDNSVDTVADWNLVVAAFVGMLGLLNARDSGKTSEDEAKALKK